MPAKSILPPAQPAPHHAPPLQGSVQASRGCWYRPPETQRGQATGQANLPLHFQGKTGAWVLLY